MVGNKVLLVQCAMVATPSTGTRRAAHKASILKTSEFIGIVLFLLASLLQRLFPLKLFVVEESIYTPFGALLIIVGIAILRWTHSELNKYNQPHFPGIPTTRLVQSGPFRFSRNPTYADVVLLFVPGTGLLLRNPWIFVLLPATICAFYVIMIEEEEIYLKEQFPGEWEGYCARTRRWI